MFGVVYAKLASLFINNSFHLTEDICLNGVIQCFETLKSCGAEPNMNKDEMLSQSGSLPLVESHDSTCQKVQEGNGAILVTDDKGSGQTIQQSIKSESFSINTLGMRNIRLKCI